MQIATKEWVGFLAEAGSWHAGTGLGAGSQNYHSAYLLERLPLVSDVLSFSGMMGPLTAEECLYCKSVQHEYYGERPSLLGIFYFLGELKMQGRLL